MEKRVLVAYASRMGSTKEIAEEVGADSGPVDSMRTFSLARRTQSQRATMRSSSAARSTSGVGTRRQART